MGYRVSILIGILLATAFLGEMKVNPFGDSFRFSLGITAFFFGMVWFRSVPVLLTGFFIGISIVWFRVALDLLTEDLHWEKSFLIHFPSTFYYFCFAVIIHATNLRASTEKPFRMGVIGTVADLTSNFVELAVRMAVGETYPFTWRTFFILLLFGCLRSFFVVGLYNIFTIRQVRALGEARQQELERLMLINSNLYEEALYLTKSMSHLEEITRKSYQLYRQLIDSNSKGALSALALQIAQNVHEVKKDSQRILAGLSKIIHQEELVPRLKIRDLCGSVIRANKQYAEMIGKQIAFYQECEINLFTNQVYALLSVLNNLVANAVEAIPVSGRIELRCFLEREELVFHVLDTGPGIASEDREWIFQPGYTTKYDLSGNPSTGIGLSHALEIVRSLNGTMTLCDHPEGITCFEVRIPTTQLIRQEVQ
ncbi:sensor histidine kinase [Effusibacillus pohliae]|uniref:sensor histidine kinase n=1 Tax=Effusibacillus pohliae TaxID=232270 RepID=UPI000374FA4F|nr:sensor histidine kinase [Effusibacillus pohliae]